MADKSRSFVQQPRGPQVAGSRRAGDRKRRKNAPAGRGLCDITPLVVRFLASIANVEDPATVSPPVALVLPWLEAICGLFSSDFPDQYLSRWRRQLRLFLLTLQAGKSALPYVARKGLSLLIGEGCSSPRRPETSDTPDAAPGYLGRGPTAWIPPQDRPRRVNFHFNRGSRLDSSGKAQRLM
jgi:hypothetical protein